MQSVNFNLSMLRINILGCQARDSFFSSRQRGSRERSGCIAQQRQRNTRPGQRQRSSCARSGGSSTQGVGNLCVHRKRQRRSSASFCGMSQFHFFFPLDNILLLSDLFSLDSVHLEILCRNESLARYAKDALGKGKTGKLHCCFNQLYL